MRSILFATLAVAAFAQSLPPVDPSPVAPAEPQYNVTIDWETAEAIGDSIVDKYEEYDKFAQNVTKAAQKELAKAL